MWETKDIHDFFLDFLQINLETPDKSADEIADESYAEFRRQGIGDDDATKMASAVAWYVGTLVKRVT